MLRLLMLLLTVVALIGCSQRESPVWQSHVLTPQQTARQLELLKAGGLPKDFQQLVGRPVSDLGELTTLANETGTRSTTTLHRFHIPGVGDGGSDGALVIESDEGRITQSFYGYPEF